MRKKIIVILAAIIIAIIAFYIYQALIEQQRKEEKFICDCQKNGTMAEVEISSKYFIPQETDFFFKQTKNKLQTEFVW